MTKYPDFGLQDGTALVTGAARGLGCSIARESAELSGSSVGLSSARLRSAGIERGAHLEAELIAREARDAAMPGLLARL